jgi:hypothetical protein
MRTPYPKTIMFCLECGRGFNLNVQEQAEEWYYGHDCESQE